MLYIISLLNVLTNSSGVIPQTLVSGEVTDVSPFLTFHFWQEVFYQQPDKSEHLGRWVGVAQGKGDVLTYLVLTNSTEQVIVRSNVCPAKDPMFPNRNARPPSGSKLDGGEISQKPVLSSLNDTLQLDRWLTSFLILTAKNGGRMDPGALPMPITNGKTRPKSLAIFMN